MNTSAHCDTCRLSRLGPTALNPRLNRAVARGRFITIEGGEGAGKTTQAGLLVAALARAGISARATREPGGSPGAKRSGGCCSKARARAGMRSVKPCCCRRPARPCDPADRAGAGAGIWVVCRPLRRFDNSLPGLRQGLALDDLAALPPFRPRRFYPGSHSDPRSAGRDRAARAAARPDPADRFERLDHVFHQRLRQGFRRIAAADSARCVLVDASNDPGVVHQAVLDTVEQRAWSGVTIECFPLYFALCRRTLLRRNDTFPADGA